jgi:hypothetical protein
MENIIDLSVWLRPHSIAEMVAILGGMRGYGSRRDDLRNFERQLAVVEDAASVLPWPVPYFVPDDCNSVDSTTEFARRLIQRGELRTTIVEAIDHNYGNIASLIKRDIVGMWFRARQSRSFDEKRTAIVIAIDKAANEVIESIAVRMVRRAEELAGGSSGEEERGVAAGR